MGWLWADGARSPVSTNEIVSGGCPVVHTRSKASSCPAGINPLNQMPRLSQSWHSGQRKSLPTQREVSTIPKKEGGTWEYPSPQQMYNALLRKGYHDTPEEHVESMVGVHNFLNEGAWQEIVKWESQHGNPEPRLLRFQGRPDEPTPKARMLQLLGAVVPKFATEPPFDRHDWYVSRGEQEVRFVIDYYSAPPEPSGEPVFYLDVRPALDSSGAAWDRTATWARETWRKAAGTGTGTGPVETPE